uniref:hypothetical protein n=1 Tax=Pseudomonas sp. FEMGT703P TaxID=2080764 RepID=UPI00259D126D
MTAGIEPYGIAYPPPDHTVTIEVAEGRCDVGVVTGIGGATRRGVDGRVGRAIGTVDVGAAGGLAAKAAGAGVAGVEGIEAGAVHPHRAAGVPDGADPGAPCTTIAHSAVVGEPVAGHTATTATTSPQVVGHAAVDDGQDTGAGVVDAPHGGAPLAACRGGASTT